ncbi:MAG: Fimbrillin-like [Bacteroidetes bacterium]|nr:Fimbrillin-like [Bacteroidota bacterium]
MKKLIFTLLITAIFAVSCSKITPVVNDKPYLAMEGKSMNIVPTKADIPLETGVKLGVYVVNVTSGSTDSLENTTISNKPLSVSSGGAISGDAIYLEEGKDYDVYAYSPRVADVSDPTAIPFTHGTDVLYTDVNKTLRGVSKGRNTVSMIFTHKMSQIKFFLLDDRDQATKDAYPFSEATFEVMGFYKDITLNLETGKITRGAVDNSIKITKQDTPVCFAPLTSLMTLSLNVTIPGAISGKQSFSGEISNTFLAGNSYSYNIKVSTTRLEITGFVTDWVPVDPEDVVVTESFSPMVK